MDCGYSLERPRRGGSNEYSQYMFWTKYKNYSIPLHTPGLLYKRGVLKGGNHCTDMFSLCFGTRGRGFPTLLATIFVLLSKAQSRGPDMMSTAREKVGEKCCFFSRSRIIVREFCHQ